MFSQTIGYAITALGHLGRRGTPMSVKELAAATGLPQAYLSKIVNTLARKGLVETQRGVNGGVSLARRPEEITLLLLCELLDEPLVRRRCLLGRPECSDQHSCPLHHFWVEERQRLVAALQGTTLADLRG